MLTADLHSVGTFYAELMCFNVQYGRVSDYSMHLGSGLLPYYLKCPKGRTGFIYLFFLELNVRIEEFSDSTKRNVIFGVCV